MQEMRHPADSQIGQTPRVCVKCQTKDEFELYKFSDKKGVLFTYAIDQLMPTLNPPGVNGVIDFEGGGRFVWRVDGLRYQQTQSRHAGRDDLPEDVHQQGHPQLFLESQAGRILIRKGLSFRGNEATEEYQSRVGITPSTPVSFAMLRMTKQEDKPWTVLKIKSPSSGWAARKFGERWDKGVEDLIVEAAYEAFEDAGIGPKDIQAAWVGTVFSGLSAITLSPLQFQYIPMTRVENMCATGSEALRAASYAVAAGVVRCRPGGRGGKA